MDRLPGRLLLLSPSSASLPQVNTQYFDGCGASGVDEAVTVKSFATLAIQSPLEVHDEEKVNCALNLHTYVMKSEEFLDQMLRLVEDYSERDKSDFGVVRGRFLRALRKWMESRINVHVLEDGVLESALSRLEKCDRYFARTHPETPHAHTPLSPKGSATPPSPKAPPLSPKAPPLSPKAHPPLSPKKPKDPPPPLPKDPPPPLPKDPPPLPKDPPPVPRLPHKVPPNSPKVLPSLPKAFQLSPKAGPLSPKAAPLSPKAAPLSPKGSADTSNSVVDSSIAALLDMLPKKKEELHMRLNKERTNSDIMKRNLKSVRESSCGVAKLDMSRIEVLDALALFFRTYDEKMIADMLSVTEWKLMRDVPLSELVSGHTCKPDTAPVFYTCVHRYNVVGAAVARTIMLHDTPDARAGMIRKFVRVAMALANMKNFTGVSQVVLALQQSALLRLKATFACLDKAARAELESVSRYTNLDRNRSVYRTEISQCTPPFIPDHSVIKKDLIFLECEMPTIRTDGLLNLTKLRKIQSIISSMEVMQAYAFKATQPLFPRPALDYETLFLNLHTVGMDGMEEMLFALSKTIEPPMNSASSSLNSPVVPPLDDSRMSLTSSSETNLSISSDISLTPKLTPKTLASIAEYTPPDSPSHTSTPNSSQPTTPRSSQPTTPRGSPATGKASKKNGKDSPAQKRKSIGALHHSSSFYSKFL